MQTEPGDHHGEFWVAVLHLRAALMHALQQDDMPVQVDTRLPKLWVGSQYAAYNVARLKAVGITHILSLSSDACVANRQFTCMQGGLKDNSHADLPSVMPAFIEFIEAGLSAGGVLVHCRAGRSRSVAVVVGYLMARFREGYFTCLQKVQHARPVAQPAPWFASQLCDFQNTLFASVASTSVCSPKSEGGQEALKRGRTFGEGASACDLGLRRSTKRARSRL